MTSMERLLGRAPDLDAVKRRLVDDLIAVLGLAAPRWEPPAA